jgi:hypothetical protein
MKRRYLKCRLLISLALPALFVPARAADLEFTLTHDSQPEKSTRDQLLKLLKQYDLSDFIWTTKIAIDSSAVAHSHPVLTLPTRYLKQDKQLVAAFIHEQYHWYEEKHRSDTDAAIAELRSQWHALPVGPPEGAEDEDSTYLNVITCYAEYQELKHIFSEGDAKKIVDFWMKDHYRAIYALILWEEINVGVIVRRHGLWPPL